MCGVFPKSYLISDGPDRESAIGPLEPVKLHLRRRLSQTIVMHGPTVDNGFDAGALGLNACTEMDWLERPCG